MAARRKRAEWSPAFAMIRRALAVLQSERVQSKADRIPPEDIGRIQEVLSDLQETIVDLERSTEERFYSN